MFKVCDNFKGSVFTQVEYQNCLNGFKSFGRFQQEAEHAVPALVRAMFGEGHHHHQHTQHRHHHHNQTTPNYVEVWENGKLVNKQNQKTTQTGQHPAEVYHDLRKDIDGIDTKNNDVKIDIDNTGEHQTNILGPGDGNIKVDTINSAGSKLVITGDPVQPVFNNASAPTT